MTRSGIIALGVKLFTEFPDLLIVKLFPIIGDDGMRDPEPAYKLLPHKILCCLVGNLYQWLGFHPLSKIINSQNCKLVLTGA